MAKKTAVAAVPIDNQEVRAPWKTLLGILAIMLVGLLWFPVMRTNANLLRNYNEGWNAYRQDMAANGIPIYGEPPGWTRTNYPPLSFHIVGLFGSITGDMNATGRWISVLSLAFIAVLLGAIVKRVTQNWYAAVYSVFCFLVWFDAYYETRVGVNDPQLLGTAFALAGIYLYLRAPDTRRALLFSAVAFSIALFIKHNVLAYAVAVGFHLLLVRREVKNFGIWLGACIGTCIALLIPLLAVDSGFSSGYFWAHLSGQPFVNWDSQWRQASGYWGVFRGPIVAAAAWCLWNAKLRERNVLIAGVAIAHAIAIAFAGGSGVDVNIFQDSTIMLAIVVGIAAADLTKLVGENSVAANGWPALAVAAAMIPFLDAETGLLILIGAGLLGFAWLAGRVSPQTLLAVAMFLVFFSIATLSPIECIRQAVFARPSLTEYEREYEAGIAALKAQPGLAICENLLMCYQAGKPEFYDPHNMNDIVVIGWLKQDVVTRLLESGSVKVVEIDGINLRAAQRPRFTEPFMRTLLEHYKITLQTNQFAILVPK